MDLNDRSYEALIEKLNKGIFNFYDIDAINELTNNLARDSKERERLVDAMKAYVKEFNANEHVSPWDYFDYNLYKWYGLLFIINDKDFLEECINGYSEDELKIVRTYFAMYQTYENSPLSEKHRNEIRPYNFFLMDSTKAIEYSDEELRYISEDNLLIRIKYYNGILSISYEDFQRLDANCRIYDRDDRFIF